MEEGLTKLAAGQKVRDLQITHIGTDTVTVTWSAPDEPKGKIKSYHVGANDLESHNMRVLETTSTEIILKNLTPDSFYGIFVRTENKQVNGSGGGVGYAVTKQIRTLPLAGQKVQDLRLYDIQSYSITVHWSPPDKPYGVIESYVVETTDVKNKTVVERRVQLNKAELHDLSPYTTYNISVWTINLPDNTSNLGGGAGEAVTKVVTTPPLAGQMVTDIQFLLIGTDNITVVWRAPDEPWGEIKSYHVDVSKSNSGYSSTSETASNGTTLTNLISDTAYDVSVRTENGQLEGRGGGVGYAVTKQTRTLPTGSPAASATDIGQ